MIIKLNLWTLARMLQRFVVQIACQNSLKEANPHIPTRLKVSLPINIASPTDITSKCTILSFQTNLTMATTLSEAAPYHPSCRTKKRRLRQTKLRRLCTRRLLTMCSAQLTRLTMWNRISRSSLFRSIPILSPKRLVNTRAVRTRTSLTRRTWRPVICLSSAPTVTRNPTLPTSCKANTRSHSTGSASRIASVRYRSALKCACALTTRPQSKGWLARNKISSPGKHLPHSSEWCRL